MFVESNLGLEIAYYNEGLGVWEPVLEPIYDAESKDFRKWEIALDVRTRIYGERQAG